MSFKYSTFSPSSHPNHESCFDSSVNLANRALSLSYSPVVTDPTGKEFTEETFFSVLDEEIIKVERFTLSKVTDLRSDLTAIESLVDRIRTEEDKVKVEHEVSEQSFQYVAVFMY